MISRVQVRAGREGLEGHLARPLQLLGRLRPGARSGPGHSEAGVGGGREVGFRDLTGGYFGGFVGQVWLLA